MTRKQAVSKAIELLSQDSNNNQIVIKLQEILEELPLSSWTHNSILDAIENYAIEHNNILPYTKEMTSENNLPSNTVIATKFGITSMDAFFKKYFSNFMHKEKSSSPYKSKNKDYFVNIFKNNYTQIKEKKKIKYVGYKLYEEYREKNTPSIITIMRNCNCASYNELLILCGFKKADKKIESTISVSYNDDESRNDEIKSLLY